MNNNSKIYVAGHNGMVGSALWRNLEFNGYTNLIGRSSNELDLRNQSQVELFFEREKPEIVFIASAKVGGINANNTQRAEFIYDNLQIQNNVIHQSYIHGVKKLLFLGSSCIYPKNCSQPIKEKYLLTGELEETNEPYSIAKIAGIKMCESYKKQYGSKFLSVMPTNLFGPGDNYNFRNSHVLPALLRKIHLGKELESMNWKNLSQDLFLSSIKSDDNLISKNTIIKTLEKIGIFLNDDKSVRVSIWGDGSPLREFLYVDDLAEACIFIMQSKTFDKIINSPELPSIINIGSGNEISIKELAFLIKDIIGFKGHLFFDKSFPNGTPRKLLDTSLLKELGWIKKHELKKSIIKTYSMYLEDSSMLRK